MVARKSSAAIGALFLIMLIIIGDVIAGMAASHVPTTPTVLPSNLCTVGYTGDTCHVNYSNRNGTSGYVFKSLVLNTVYCTGVTTNPLVVTNTTGSILVGGAYTFRGRNATATLHIQVWASSTVVPANVFQAGACAAETTLAADLYYKLDLSGTVASSYRTNSFNAVFTAPNAGSYYAWIDITPVDNSVQIDQISTSKLFMLQLL